MNPFLHATVASPASVPNRSAERVRRSDGSVRRVPGRTRWPRMLRAAGLAALAWAGTAGAVDLNTATLEQLRGVRGIGPKTAQIILQERERGGSYASFADLSDRVRGIGPKRAQGLQAAGLTIDGGGMRLSGQGERAQKAQPAARARAPTQAASAAR
ncbi:Competence protein ComEA OS=Castellaniella defragrans OX=75697 GN=HNR28_000866 PE=4 SV=1 [Castellaniella defragrans]